jgi:hypothetical protein
VLEQRLAALTQQRQQEQPLVLKPLV